MTKIKNLKLIKDILNASQLKSLEAGAALHFSHRRIEFKILSIDSRSVTIIVTQGKRQDEFYLSSNELAERAKDLFKEFLPNLLIKARAIPYRDL